MIGRLFIKGMMLGMMVMLMTAGLSQSAWAASPGAAVVILTSPTVCPAAGCAAGQRLNYKVDFDLGTFLDTLSPNVQVCVYSPLNWSVDSVSFSAIGGVSGAPYSTGTASCDAAPGGYALSGGTSGQVGAGSFGDSLNFGFRIGGGATSGGSILVRVFEQSTPGAWVRTSQTFSSINLVPSTENVYVANDASTCGSNSPCYVNSAEDLPGGIGTGLKDALDSRSLPTTITILGNYSIKDNSILVNSADVLQGGTSSSLSYNGTQCTQPMLKVTAGATIKNLIIRDGNCSGVSRDLLVVESASPVLIERNTLTSGKDAIHVTDANSANLTVQFNQITGNNGYAIWLGPANTGTLDAVGNNFYGNRSGTQVECNSHGKVEHNYWGAGVSTTTAASNCNVTETRRLGAPALLNQNGAGAIGSRVTVSEIKASFLNSVGFQRTGGTDFDIYLIDHGVGSTINIPFTAGSPTNLNPCSSYWDIFLADGVTPSADTVLSLFFKYDLSTGCIATISSTRYCNQPDPVDPNQFPLYWYDPTGYPTNLSWVTTNSTGQTTTCQIAENEIRVDIDGSGRPGLTDLSFLPFVVGLPGQPTAVELVSFNAKVTGGSAWAFIVVAILVLMIGIRIVLSKGGRHAA